jgi:hypothetical protein
MATINRLSQADRLEFATQELAAVERENRQLKSCLQWTMNRLPTDFVRELQGMIALAAVPDHWDAVADERNAVLSDLRAIIPLVEPAIGAAKPIGANVP